MCVITDHSLSLLQMLHRANDLKENVCRVWNSDYLVGYHAKNQQFYHHDKNSQLAV